MRSSIVASQRIAMSADEILYSLITALISCLLVSRSVLARMPSTYVVVNMRQGHRVGNRESSLVLFLEDDVWRLLVDSNPESFKLGFDDSLVCEGLVDIQDDEYQMAGLGNRNDLATTAFAVLCALNDTWQIQHLDVGAIVLNLARHGRKGRELVCRS